MRQAAGLGPCLLPKTTEVLATYTDATNTTSPFTTEQLVEAAVATEEYTMFSNDYDELMEVIQRINIEADTPYAGVSIEDLAEADESYTLTADAISHLDDCYNLVNTVRAFLIVFAVAGVVLCIVLCTRGAEGRIVLSRAMRATAVIFAVIIIALVVYAAIDFNAFFSAFHEIFFPQGNWTFAADSLLISMYPTNFWMGMAIIWVVTSLLCALIVFALGAAIKPRKVK